MVEIWQGLTGWLHSLVGGKPGETVRDAIEELIEEHDGSETSIDEAERSLLANILRLRDVTARDVMIPRAEITGVEVRTGLDELLGLFARSAHSRLPVYRRNLDDAFGYVHVRDVLAASRMERPVPPARLVRRVLFVSPSMPALDLLLEMRRMRNHMALVVDEYGGVDGLATIEDVIESIVGNIEDEHDRGVEPGMVTGPDGVIEADARISVEEFEAQAGPKLTEEERDEVDTLGGLVVFLAGRVPARGELIHHSSGLEFEVIEADPRRVTRLKIRGAGG